MPYNELINDYEFVRDYLREFYIYGYRTKEETVSKQSRKHTQENKGTSNRSYEDKKRQIRSWLLGYIEDKKYVDGYVPYISIDSTGNGEQVKKCLSESTRQKREKSKVWT